jgi:hypothetical protein
MLGVTQALPWLTQTLEAEEDDHVVVVSGSIRASVEGGDSGADPGAAEARFPETKPRNEATNVHNRLRREKSWLMGGPCLATEKDREVRKRSRKRVQNLSARVSTQIIHIKNFTNTVTNYSKTVTNYSITQQRERQVGAPISATPGLSKKAVPGRWRTSSVVSGSSQNRMALFSGSMQGIDEFRKRGCDR